MLALLLRILLPWSSVQTLVVVQPAPENEPAPFENQVDTDFAKSVKKRVMIMPLLRQIRGAAQFDFDFACFVAVAAALAGVGLATNNAVVIVASMLVSPIMGPILGVTLGIFMGDRALIKTGLRSEGIAFVM